MDREGRSDLYINIASVCRCGNFVFRCVKEFFLLASLIADHVGRNASECDMVKSSFFIGDFLIFSG